MIQTKAALKAALLNLLIFHLFLRKHKALKQISIFFVELLHSKQI